MRLNLSFLRIFPISLFFFFLDIKKGLDSLKPLFMRFPSHLIPNFPAKSLFLFFSHFKWLDTLIIRNEILDSLGKQASKQAKSDLNSTSQSKQIILQEINKVKEKRTILEKIIRLFTKHKRITAKQNKQKFIVPFK